MSSPRGIWTPGEAVSKKGYGCNVSDDELQVKEFLECAAASAQYANSSVSRG